MSNSQDYNTGAPTKYRLVLSFLLTHQGSQHVHAVRYAKDGFGPEKHTSNNGHKVYIKYNACHVSDE